MDCHICLYATCMFCLTRLSLRALFFGHAQAMASGLVNGLGCRDRPFPDTTATALKTIYIYPHKFTVLYTDEVIWSLCDTRHGPPSSTSFHMTVGGMDFNASAETPIFGSSSPLSFQRQVDSSTGGTPAEHLNCQYRLQHDGRR